MTPIGRCKLPFIFLVALVLSGVLVGRIAYAQSANCSYIDAAQYDGWGWDPVARVSCAPRETDNDACDYSSADRYDGWGWNPDTRQSCAPRPQPPGAGNLCDYVDAEHNGGWGWNKTDKEPCPPKKNAVHPVCTSARFDADGDGFGWENSKTCIVDTTVSNTMSPSGSITTVLPTYSWPAKSNADLYRLVISDNAGNGFSHEIDPMTAGCQSGSGTCRATPDLSYPDNSLTWKVETIVAGRTQSISPAVGFTTPVSLNLQPVTSNPDACEAYPAVAYGKFIAINNIWNARSMYRDGWSQTIRIDQTLNNAPKASWSYDWLAESDGGIYDVKSYPEVVYGNKLGVHVSGTKADTGLPTKVSDIDEFTIDFSYSDLGSAERNVALESFFHESCNITGPCDTYDNRIFEMMVWVNNPSVRTPGDLTLTGVMIDNHLWNVYTKPRSNKKYIAFTAQTPITSGTLHWNRFVEWAADWTRENSIANNINVLEPHYCMGAIEIGTEVWNGSGTFTLDDYRITRE